VFTVVPYDRFTCQRSKPDSRLVLCAIRHPLESVYPDRIGTLALTLSSVGRTCRRHRSIGRSKYVGRPAGLMGAPGRVRYGPARCWITTFYVTCVLRRELLVKCRTRTDAHLLFVVLPAQQLRFTVAQRSFLRKIMLCNRIRLIYIYKIVFGLVTNAGDEFFTLANSVSANINTRGHMYKLFPHHSRNDARKCFHWASCARVKWWTKAF